MQLRDDIYGLLNAEITRERFASAAYTAIEAWANDNAFPGLEGWAKAAAAEEAEHARTLIDYVNSRAVVRVEAVDAPPVLPGEYAGVLEAALTLEQSVTAAFVQIADAAADASDYATLELAQHFLDEQRQAEHELEIAIRKVRRGAPIDLLDAELWEDA